MIDRESDLRDGSSGGDHGRLDTHEESAVV